MNCQRSNLQIQFTQIFRFVFFSLFASTQFLFAQGVNRASVLDINGDRRTDFHVITRRDGLFPLIWGFSYSTSTSSGSGGIFFGYSPTIERMMSGDFDGDGDSELVVYSAEPNSVLSSHFDIVYLGPFRVDNVDFGLSTDDPTVIGDYDGDRKSDVSVFRCNANDAVGTQCFWIYRSSQFGTVNWVPWGNVYAPGKADVPVPGDYDGDGKDDFAVKRLVNSADPNGLTRFFILRSSDGLVEYHDFGLGGDRTIRGDFDGDSKNDLCAVRNSETAGTTMLWFIRYSSTGEFALYIPWGLGRSGSAGDYFAPGDYDGDGRTDIAVWRRTTLNEPMNFWILPSGQTPRSFGRPIIVPFSSCGQQPKCEYPVAQFQVH